MDSLLWRILQCSEYPSGHVNWDFYGYRLAGMLTRQGGERVFECNLRSVKKRVPWDWQEERLSWLISLTLCLLLKPQLHHTAYCTAAAAQCPSQKQFKLLKRCLFNSMAMKNIVKRPFAEVALYGSEIKYLVKSQVGSSKPVSSHLADNIMKLP